MSKYLRSRSMPTNCKPIRAQATPVVPLPMKGSHTVRASGAKFRHHSMTRSGFCEGCPTLSAFVAAMLCSICRALISSEVHAISNCAIVGGASGFFHESQDLRTGKTSA